MSDYIHENSDTDDEFECTYGKCYYDDELDEIIQCCQCRIDEIVDMNETFINEQAAGEEDEWFQTTYRKWLMSKKIIKPPAMLLDYVNEFNIINSNKKKHMKQFQDEIYYELIEVTMHPDYIKNTRLLDWY